MKIEEQIKNYAGQPITKQILLDLLRDYKRPYDKINEMVRQGVLILVKRGIYIPGPNSHVAGPEPFLLANCMYGPSYVSFESALSYRGLIPERVYESSSATTRSTKLYKTPAGRFSYIHLPLPYYSYGIQQVQLGEKQVALVASAEKAICDKIIATAGLQLRSMKQTMEFLTEDLRIEKQALRNLNVSHISSWTKHAEKSDSLKMLVKTLVQYD